MNHNPDVVHKFQICALDFVKHSATFLDNTQYFFVQCYFRTIFLSNLYDCGTGENTEFK